MCNVRVGRRRDRGLAVQLCGDTCGGVAGLGDLKLFSKLDQCLVDMSSEVFRRFEEGSDPLFADPILQGCQLDCTRTSLYLTYDDRLILMDKKDQPRLVKLNREIEFHLGDRKI